MRSPSASTLSSGHGARHWPMGQRRRAFLFCVALGLQPGDLAAALQPIVHVGLAGEAGDVASFLALITSLDLPVALGDTLGNKNDAGLCHGFICPGSAKA